MKTVDNYVSIVYKGQLLLLSFWRLFDDFSLLNKDILLKDKKNSFFCHVKHF